MGGRKMPPSFPLIISLFTLHLIIACVRVVLERWRNGGDRSVRRRRSFDACWLSAALASGACAVVAGRVVC